MASYFEADPLFNDLTARLSLSRVQTRLYNEYYEGEHKLVQLGLAIPEELKQFTVNLNWARVVVDAIEQRLNVIGFKMPGTDVADSSLWDIWQYNNMDERAGFTHTDALALGRSYVCVGTNDEDPKYPIITVESASEMATIRDPRTFRIIAAMRLYSDISSNGIAFDNRCTLYLPNETRWLVRDQGGDWEDEVDPDVHNLGTPPVVPFINRNRAARPNHSILEGVSEMHDVIPISDSASRSLTNLQLAQETVAVPQKYVLGMSKGDFVDASGSPLPVWQSYFGAVWANGNKDASVGQLPSADLTNFDTTLNLYARQASSVTGLPIEYFGLNTVNPPSAEGQRAGETRLIMNAKRKTNSFGSNWESVQRLVLRFRDGVWDPNARRMETQWQDVGTPTQAQVTDAVVKEYQTGLTDWETAQEELGRSPETIAEMKGRREADAGLALGVGIGIAQQTQAALEA